MSTRQTITIGVSSHCKASACAALDYYTATLAQRLVATLSRDSGLHISSLKCAIHYRLREWDEEYEALMIVTAACRSRVEVWWRCSRFAARLYTGGVSSLQARLMELRQGMLLCVRVGRGRRGIFSFCSNTAGTKAACKAVVLPLKTGPGGLLCIQ